MKCIITLLLLLATYHCYAAVPHRVDVINGAYSTYHGLEMVTLLAAIALVPILLHFIRQLFARIALGMFVVWSLVIAVLALYTLTDANLYDPAGGNTIIYLISIVLNVPLLWLCFFIFKRLRKYPQI